MPRGRKPKVTVEKPNTSKSSDQSLFDKLQTELTKNQSYVNLVLGALIVLVLGVLLFNYFTRPAGNVGSAQSTSPAPSGQQADVNKDNLPGPYTVKDGDTLFLIAEKYYGDGYQFPEIAKKNNIADADVITTGQVLQIPKLTLAQASTEPSAQPTDNSLAQASVAPVSSDNSLTQASPTPAATDNSADQNQTFGTGGPTNQTIWGERIEGTTYTVQAGDWLSKIAGRAYGDIMQYQKLAEVNHIANPDVIEPGTVLQIPR